MAITENKNTIGIYRQFNNYFSRTIIYYDDADEYDNHSSGHEYFDGINFKPGDDVFTELILNCSEEQAKSNYLIVTDAQHTRIESRWFIQHPHRIRNGQYQFKLRRDVIADNLGIVRELPIFVQKGYLNDLSPFIVADEGMNLNQVKIGERLIKDQTNVGWIVGYLNDTAPQTTVNVPYTTSKRTMTISQLAEETGIDESYLSNIMNIDDDAIKSKYVYGDVRYRLYSNLVDGSNNEFLINGYLKNEPSNGANADHFNEGIPNEERYAYITSHDEILADRFSTLPERAFVDLGEAALSDYGYYAINKALNENKTQARAFWMDAYGIPYISQSQFNKLLSLSGNVLIQYNNGYYNLSISTKSSPSTSQAKFNINAHPMLRDLASDVVDYFNEGIISSSDHMALLSNAGKVGINATQYEFAITLSLDVQSSITATISAAATRNSLTDAPYDIFAIPYGESENIGVGGQPSTHHQDTFQDNAEQDPSSLRYFAHRSVSPIGYNPSINKVTSITLRIDQASLEDVIDYNATFNQATGQIDIEIEATGLYTIEYDLDYDIEPIGAVVLSKEQAIDVAIALYKSLTSSNCYDIQLLPYCPIQDRIVDGKIDVSSMSEHYDYDKIVDGSSNPLSYIFYPKKSSISFTIDESLSMDDDYKTESNCTNYRLVSPNYQGGFDFNLAKNGGYVSFYEVAYTLKPYSPYIRVTPQLGFLYGTNYQDGRGLVCGGNFSIPLLTDAWNEWEIRNKNYQNIFDRGIQSLEVKQSIERRIASLQGTMGILGMAVGGTTQGAMTGAKVGGVAGPYGAAIGGAIGAVAGGVVNAGVGAWAHNEDMSNLYQLQREERRYAIDKYNYDLGNIKALPNSLTNIGALNKDNKIFPFLEKYSCTQEEKDAFKSKIQYDSMIVMKIDILDNYIYQGQPHYFKGTLIRASTLELTKVLDGDDHMANAINEELEKGVYI